MAKFTNPLDSIKVASPCSADWDAMIGNNRQRHCGDCKLDVYNLSGMTKRDAENLIMNSEGRLCARFFRRADGTVTTTVGCGPMNGTTMVDPVTGCITYEPTMDFVGMDTICVINCDDNGICDTTLVPITVTPVVDTIPTTIPEDSSFTICPDTLTTMNGTAIKNVRVVYSRWPNCRP